MGRGALIRVGAVVAALVAVITAVTLAMSGRDSVNDALSIRGAAVAPPVRVLPLGDSITWGQGSPTRSSYRAPLWRLVAGQSKYTIRFVGRQISGALPEPANEGHRGYTINRIMQGVDAWMAAARPDVVILHIGINDLCRHIDVPHAPDRLAVLVNRIYLDRPGVSIIFMGLIPTTPNIGPQIAAYNARARALARTEQLAGRSFRYVTPPALTSADRVDQLHPNDIGYRLIAKAVFPALSTTIAQRTAASAVPASAG